MKVEGKTQTRGKDIIGECCMIQCCPIEVGTVPLQAAVLMGCPKTLIEQPFLKHPSSKAPQYLKPVPSLNTHNCKLSST